MAGERLINKLTNAMSDDEASASISCGGYNGIHRYWDTTREEDFTSTYLPSHHIRWDASDSICQGKLLSL
jgi:hypothetical protein